MRLQVLSIVGYIGHRTMATPCLEAPPMNCRGRANFSLDASGRGQSCIRFSDLPGDCDLELSCTSEAHCPFHIRGDLRVALARNGSDEETIGTGTSPLVRSRVKPGFHELVLYNNDWTNVFSVCPVSISDAIYCCVPLGGQVDNRTARKTVEDVEIKELEAHAEFLQRSLTIARTETTWLLHALEATAAVSIILMVLLLKYCLFAGKLRPNAMEEPLLQQDFISNDRISNKCDGTSRQSSPPSIENASVGRFQPRCTVFDFENGSGKLIRCIRVEASGRRVEDNSRTVSGHVELEGMIDSSGTIVRVHLMKEYDLPAAARSSMAAALNRPRAASVGTVSLSSVASMNPGIESAVSADTCGIWEKTFRFEDGSWEMLSPESASIDSRGLDMHGVWQIQLVRLEQSLIRVLSDAPKPRCPVFELGNEAELAPSEIDYGMQTMAW